MSIGAIDTSRIEAMVAQLRAAAAQAKPAGNAVPDAGAPKAASAVDFSSALKSSLEQVNRMQADAQQQAQRFAMGDSSVSLSDAMISLQKSGIALQQTIQVRNKLVQSYQEIMNMGI
ncbi:flagellar hook-basal body complex protein FliE [Betaproteobacteria bacterium SCN1]|jgi:flagellar hook-basal body complex protein FliE|nr:flagellar hook-basal body complex protein FliE [Betaproteobacteria bacterium SCN1]